MSKEAALKRAFNQAIANPAVSFADREADILVMRNVMIAYVRKNNIDISAAEIAEYVRVELEKIDEALKDFSYSDQMMSR